MTDVKRCKKCKHYAVMYTDEPCLSCDGESCFEYTDEETHFFGSKYKKGIDDLLNRQIQKGVSKYGQTLEDNVTLTTGQRIEHLEEELADAMMYCEHLKEAISGTNLTADDYQRAALRTARTDELAKEEILLNGVMGLCGEAGEVIDLLKKARFQGHELDREKMILECGDLMWYAAVTSHALDAHLSEVMQKNIDKLKQRYPSGFDKARSINRAEGQT